MGAPPRGNTPHIDFHEVFVLTQHRGLKGMTKASNQNSFLKVNAVQFSALLSSYGLAEVPFYFIDKMVWNPKTPH